MLLLATKVWEQRKLGEMITERKILRFDSREFPLSSFIKNEGVVPKSSRYDRSFLVKSNSKKYKETRLGDFIYSSNNLDTGSIGLNNYGNAVISPVYSVFTSKDTENLETSFINLLFKKNFYKNKMLRFRQGVTYGQWKIKENDFLNLKVYTSNSIEIEKIIAIFSKISQCIALYERKTRLLGKLRTFLTQRLFSNSSKVSLYFDNKNWSKHKISEFLTERNEKVVPNSSIPLVSFTVEKGVTPKSKRYNREFLVKDDNKKYKITKKDDIVYNPANLKFGAIARNKFGNAAFSPIYVTFITKLNPAFTEFLVCRKDFINLALKYQEGTVYERMAVKSKDFLNLKIYLPNSSRDINHIAQILQSLDTLVSLNKNKVSLITLIKKELLNTMFI